MTKKKKSSKKGEHKKGEHHTSVSHTKKSQGSTGKSHWNYYVWPIVAVFMTVIFLIVVFNKPSCNGGNSSGALTGNAVDELIFVKSDACNEACNQMEPVARDVADTADLEFRKITTPQQIPIPGYMIIENKETRSLLRPLQDKATFYNEVCGVTNNTEVCNEAKSLAQESQKKSQEAKNSQLESLPKQETPEVEMFVMSHCPYGTQIEKGMLPVMETLGNKADIKVKFVDYAMHGEKELNEQLRQYCIQKEQPEKFQDYLSCFLEDGSTEQCLGKADIDTEMMESCVKTADEEYNVTEMFNDKSTWVRGRYPKFLVHKDLNEEYGIKGSPGLVINGEQLQTKRDPASLLEAVCAGFSEKPSECETQLSGQAPSPGFGYGGSASAGSGSCG